MKSKKMSASQASSPSLSPLFYQMMSNQTNCCRGTSTNCQKEVERRSIAYRTLFCASTMTTMTEAAHTTEEEATPLETFFRTVFRSIDRNNGNGNDEGRKRSQMIRRAVKRGRLYPILDMQLVGSIITSAMTSLAE